jgi:hypothetical protein
MKKKGWSWVALGTVFILFASCVTFQADGLEKGVVANGSPYEVVGHFTEHEWVNKFLGSSGGPISLIYLLRQRLVLLSVPFKKT